MLFAVIRPTVDRSPREFELFSDSSSSVHRSLWGIARLRVILACRASDGETHPSRQVELRRNKLNRRFWLDPASSFPMNLDVNPINRAHGLLQVDETTRTRSF